MKRTESELRGIEKITCKKTRNKRNTCKIIKMIKCHILDRTKVRCISANNANTRFERQSHCDVANSYKILYFVFYM